MLVTILCSSFIVFSLWFTVIELVVMMGMLLTLSVGGTFFYSANYFDFLSVVMVCLTGFFYLGFVLMSSKYSKKAKMTYKHLFFLLVWMVVLCFSFKSVWGFYLFFEFSLIPLLLVIFWLGYQVERMQASFYLFFYTMFGSLPLLMILLSFHKMFSQNSFSLFELGGTYMSLALSLVLAFIFFIKLPVFLFHLWLPKAHVEAPVAGSMILAAILLKLGGYGLFRFFWLSSSCPSFFLFSVSLWGGVLSALVCLVQSDLKALVAYSSISHMGVMVAGFFLFSYFSMKGFFIIMISHAFCSSALFFFVNLLYERTLTRQAIFSRTLGGTAYQYLFVLFVFLAANFSAPPSFNLFGELVLFFSFFSYSFLGSCLLASAAFFVAFYCIYAYSNISQGKVWSFKGFYISTDYEFMVLYFHLFPVFLMVMFLKSL